MFPSKAIKMYLSELNEAEKELENSSFHLVGEPIKNALYREKREVSKSIQDGIPVKELVYNSISNLAGDLVESGSFHLHRGLLNPIGPGPDLLKLYDDAMDKLVEFGAIEESFAKEQKSGIRTNIKSVG